jgi:hypothetical protein
MEDLRGGALLSIGDDMWGRDLSEGFASLILDFLQDQIGQIDEAGGVQV